MNWHRLPPLNALRAFAALAETGSYTTAGSALNVTHAAVLQQVRALERHLDARLVTREGRGIALTPDGEVLARSVERGFEHFMRGAEEVGTARQARPVQVTMSPAFAVKWLMPRIVDFQTRYPDITLMLSPTGRIVDLAATGIDVAIRYARLPDLPEGADVLVTLDLCVAGAPGLLAPDRVRAPADLLRLPWMQELGTNESSEWFERRGVPITRPLMISHMPGNLILEALARGDGVTYTARQWLSAELDRGSLVAAFPEPGAGVFHIQLAPGEPRPQVRRFVSWLKEQAEVPAQSKPENGR